MRCLNCPDKNVIENMGVLDCVKRPQCLFEDISRRNQYAKLNLVSGCKILLYGQKRKWTIQACDDRFIIATRKWGKRYFYFIGDLHDCIRGTGKEPFVSQDNILEKLHNGQIQISIKDWVPLDIQASFL